MTYIIQHIKLVNFKNYKQLNVQLNQKFNAFIGLNGMGKTNLLDAVYYLCMGKSYFTTSDKNVVCFEQDFIRLKANIIDDQEQSNHEVIVKVIPSKSKEIHYNNKKYSKLSEHVGFMPVVIIAPGDVYNLLDTSEFRRKFLDSTLIQFDKEYLHHLITYNRVLAQRNALLKQFADRQAWDQKLLDILNDKMKEPANYIYKRRKEEVDLLIPIFQDIYQRVSGKAERCLLKYSSALEQKGWNELLSESIEKDRILRRSAAGIHKDDIAFYINDKKLKTFASQGQLKSFVFSLKLAQYHFIKNKTGKKPILLLDDIFDKLDEARVKSLIDIISESDYGQIFLTDTSMSRVQQIFDDLELDFAIMNIERGEIINDTIN